MLELCAILQRSEMWSPTDLNIFSRTGPCLMSCHDTQYISTIVGRIYHLHDSREGL